MRFLFDECSGEAQHDQCPRSMTMNGLPVGECDCACHVEAAYQWLRSAKDEPIRCALGDTLREHRARNLNELRERLPGVVVSLHHQLSRSTP